MNTIYNAVLFIVALQGTPSPVSIVETWQADSKTAAIAACELLKPDRVAAVEETGKNVVIARCFWTREKIDGS